MTRPMPRLACVLAAAALLLAGCGSVRNTVADGDDAALMLRGNDPVAYFTEKRAVRGSTAIEATHDGATYRFATETNRAAFLANPARYEPAYAGFCASGAPYALKAAIGADVFYVYNDRLYLFGSERSRVNWVMDAAENVRVGDAYWANETKDVPYRLQNAKRYVFKVPGYKTDAELDAERERRRAAGTLARDAQ
jgi:YHS domain-containing protein